MGIARRHQNIVGFAFNVNACDGARNPVIRTSKTMKRKGLMTISISEEWCRSQEPFQELTGVGFEIPRRETREFRTTCRDTGKSRESRPHRKPKRSNSNQ